MTTTTDPRPPDVLVTFALSDEDVSALLDLLAAAQAGRDEALRMAEGDERRLAELEARHQAQEALERLLAAAVDDGALALVEEPDPALPERVVLHLPAAGRWMAGPGVAAAREALRAAETGGDDDHDRWVAAVLAVAQMQARAVLSGVRGPGLRPLARLLLALVAEAQQDAHRDGPTAGGRTCAGAWSPEP